MRLEYDKVADAAMIYLVDGPIQSARQDVELDNAAIILDFDSADRLIAIEVMGASRVLPPQLTS
ncbi:MAG: DUF2283 domain-containing protein [Nocardiaceae bacterium]|nr:DUF2283 domain-containing protein [Nocardiaceae bacterium]